MFPHLRPIIPLGMIMGLAFLIYYQIKPFIPKILQIYVRRKWVSKKLASCKGFWPIDERAGACPEGWVGWPEGKRFAIVLTHDVETEQGIERCIPLAEIEKNLGFRSSFNFVAEDYAIPDKLFDFLKHNRFEIGLHGLRHNGNMFRSKRQFHKKASRINRYLKEWGCKGFRAPSMYHNLERIGALDIEYDTSTFDTDPFEPQPDGVGTIFPFWVSGDSTQKGYVELPYTLPQDHTLFVVMGERDITIWKKKLDWIAKRGGMALVIIHPDYMNFNRKGEVRGEYPASYVSDLLEYIKNKYKDQYWHVLPQEMARFLAKNYVNKKG
jgi:hypothetical protein